MLAFIGSILLSILCLLCIGDILCQAQTSQSIGDGIRLYNQHDFRGALSCFVADSHANSDVTAAYYAALCYQQLGQWDEAKSSYQSVIDKFPSSDAARLAKVALSQLSGAAGTSGIVSSRESLYGSGIATSLPKETWIPFERHGNELLVNVEINKCPAKMYFDTGAAICMLPRAYLLSMGIKVPTGPPEMSIAGVGGKGFAPAWRMHVDLKVGRIERRNFPITVADAPLDVGLLGLPFFTGYEYTIDDQAKAISFVKPDLSDVKTPLVGSSKAMPAMTVNSSGNYIYNVPCKIKNHSIIVMAKVNGNNCEMMFDTGASTCTFTSKQFSDAGLKIDPERVRAFNMAGVSGRAHGAITVIDSVELGPIRKKNVVVAITDAAKMVDPLLGQNFFGDWQFTIDYANQIIRFTKK
jgi:clan AA aspartic protease (TIGR02281 family)